MDSNRVRVLLIGINYAPEESGNAPYTTGLAEHLVEQGHDVDVLTGLPHYPSWRPHANLGHGSTELNGVRVHRRWHYIPERHSALRRGLYEASFLGSAALMRGLQRPDAIVGVIPSISDGVLARVAARRFDVPYGLLFQDLMGRAAGQSGIAGGGSVEGLVRRSEGWIARGAASVAVVAEGFRPYLESLGVASESIHRVRNWTHVPEPDTERVVVRESLGWPGDAFVCLHAGNMGHKQGLETVIEAARLASEKVPELRFVLMGDGNQRAVLEAAAARYDLANLQFLPPQSDPAYASALAAADALLLSLNPQVTDMAFPSKVGSYVAASNPIVASVSPQSEIGKELENHAAALMVQPGSSEDLLEGIIRLASDEVLRRRLVNAAQEYGRTAFARDAALQELESFIYGIAGMPEPVERGREALEAA